MLRQLTGTSSHQLPRRINNTGFAWDYEALARTEGYPTGHGAEIMGCHDPSSVPILSTFALEFAVCDHWLCSVPSETWPNRNFALAATFDGEVNVAKRPYFSQTIFELLEENGISWRVFHDGSN